MRPRHCPSGGGRSRVLALRRQTPFLRQWRQRGLIPSIWLRNLSGISSFDRHALPAMALTTDSSILTAVGNDFLRAGFSRQIEALGSRWRCRHRYQHDGQSPNVVAAMRPPATQSKPSAFPAKTGSLGGMRGYSDRRYFSKHRPDSGMPHHHWALDLRVCGKRIDVVGLKSFRVIPSRPFSRKGQ